MKCLVTGAAGFIGSHLCRKLLDMGSSVTGIDSFTDFYPRWIKEKNVISIRANPHFRLIDKDINSIDLNPFLEDTEAVFHLAAQAGVRTSWGEQFSVYTENNITATQKLLEAAKGQSLNKFIYASSSSVYGLSSQLPMTETASLHPFSPYGVSKLAGEHLCFLYAVNFSVPVVCLRFFTVYGPGQRPDMAFHRFMKDLFENKALSLFGDGEQTRDFTYIDDIIDASIAAMTLGKEGEIYNVGGGDSKKLMDVFDLLENITQKKVILKKKERMKGDVLHTCADIQKAKKDLGYRPKTPIESGLQREWEWIKNLYAHKMSEKE